MSIYYKTLHLILLTYKDISRHQQMLTAPLFIAQYSYVWFYFTFFHGFSVGSRFTGLNGGFIFQPWGFYMWMCIHEASVEYSHMKQACYEALHFQKKIFIATLWPLVYFCTTAFSVLCFTGTKVCVWDLKRTNRKTEEREKEKIIDINSEQTCILVQF